VRIYTFVRAPYDSYVHTDSRFWNAGGFSISAGSQGVRANVESLQALISGGVAFDSPTRPPAASAAKADAEFTLFDDQSSAVEAPHEGGAFYLIRLPGAVRGLAAGDEVDLKGMAVGQVTDVSLVYDIASNEVSTPATIEIYPERISFGSTPVPHGGAVQPFFDTVIRKLVGAGLRARLGSGSLLTGQRLIALDLDQDDPPGELQPDGDRLVIPTTDSGDLDSLSNAAAHVMKKISAMPLADIGKSVRNVLDHLDKITGSPDVKQSIHSLNEALQGLNKLTNTANTELPPLLASVRQTADAATKTLSVLGGKEGGRDADLPALMHELTEAARSLRSLADFLQEHPEALIKGRTESEK
jgi:paraquat-inducible protein B